MKDIVEAAEALVDAVTFDDSGAAGQGGNGGLLSRETIRKSDTLRALLLRWRKQNHHAKAPELPV